MGFCHASMSDYVLAFLLFQVHLLSIPLQGRFSCPSLGVEPSKDIPHFHCYQWQQANRLDIAASSTNVWIWKIIKLQCYLCYTDLPSFSVLLRNTTCRISSNWHFRNCFYLIIYLALCWLVNVPLLLVSPFFPCVNWKANYWIIIT